MGTVGSSGSPAADSVAELMGESIGVRACAILAADGSVLAGSSEIDWTGAVGEIWSAAQGGGEGSAQVHVATEDGEVYVVRDDSHTAVAIADRFTLASLMFCDLRSALRKLRDPG